MIVFAYFFQKGRAFMNIVFNPFLIIFQVQLKIRQKIAMNVQRIQLIQSSLLFLLNFLLHFLFHFIMHAIHPPPPTLLYFTMNAPEIFRLNSPFRIALKGRMFHSLMQQFQFMDELYLHGKGKPKSMSFEFQKVFVLKFLWILKIIMHY